ncbi:MAG: hypothetical protein FWH29_01235 [Methanobrevibacter sp.]|nr:hypothetical protein [Methanobrevibacter sp.]
MKLEDIDDLEIELPEIEFPEIELETDDLLMILTLKKDYSQIKNIEKRKKEFIEDLKGFIDEFVSNPEFNELMEYY